MFPWAAEPLHKCASDRFSVCTAGMENLWLSDVGVSIDGSRSATASGGSQVSHP